MPSYSDYDGRRPYADVIGAFRGGAGRAYQSQGRYDDAIRIDPDNADAYMSLRNAEEARRREEESRNANRATAEALRQGDYDGAERAAAGQGDVGTVTAVQRMRRENDRTRRVEAWRELRRYRSEVNGLADLQGDEQQARYADILNRARAESADSPEMLQFLSTLPAQFNPRVGGMLDARLRDWMEMLLDPEELAEMEREEARAERGQRRTLTPEEVRAAGLRPGTVAQTDGSGQIYVIQQPRDPNIGAGRVTYRPLSPEEAQRYGVSGAGYQISSTGQVSRIGGGAGAGPMLAGAEQRGRIALSFTNIIQAQEELQRLEEGAVARQGSHGSNTPLGQDWGARIAEAIPWDGGSVARYIGGEDYQAYETASRTFEQSMIPIFSGSAVTDSEAQRFVRANLPRMNDSAETLATKALNRQRMINAAAVILGTDPPYPEAGVWSPSGGLVPPQGDLDSMSDEELERIANGGQ